MKEPSKYWIELAKMSGQAKKPVEPRFDNPEDNLESYLVLQRERSAGGLRASQNGWIEYYSQDVIWDFPSSAQYYQIFKQIRKERNQTLLEALRQDWKDGWTATSTRIQYLPNSLNTKIVHNYGSYHEKGIEVLIPVYREGVYLNQISDQLEAETYLQALFDTQDNFDEMVDILEYASGKSMEDIKLWTPIQNNRASRPERSVHLHDDGVGFLVDGNGRPGVSIGFSRGVTNAT